MSQKSITEKLGEIDELVAEGKVEQREFRGIMYFWAK